jgi:hypothetical protein
MNTVTLEMSALVEFVGLLFCTVKENTSWLVMPPPLLIHCSVILPFCVMSGRASEDEPAAVMASFDPIPTCSG